MMLDEPLSDEVRLCAERALFRTRGDGEGAANVLAEMLRARPDLLNDIAGGIIRSVHRVQAWGATESDFSGGGA